MGGTHKGLEIVAGARIIDRVADALRRVCGRVLLAANDADAASWLPGTEVVADLHAGRGGLAGVEAAIARAGDVVVVAWDMPFVSDGMLRELTRRAPMHGADIVVPESDSPHGFEPFCAYYSARVLPDLGEFLERGGGAAREFIGQAKRVHRIPLQDVARHGDVATMFYGVNTSEELARARTIAAHAG
jgi:molybdopterin-guanine dinucleotide biosynthesis protein A